MQLLTVIAEHLNRRLQPGDVGIIGARAGVGKTACLAQIALADLVAGHTVLHVALDATVDHVREWYDRLLDEARRASPEDALTEQRHEVERRRHIHSYPSRGFDAPRLGLALHFLAEVMDFRPRTVVVDGLRSDDLDPVEVRKLRELAQQAGFALWLSMKTNGEGSTPLEVLAEAATVVVQLEPGKDGMALRVDLDRRTGRSGELPLVLDPATLLLRNV